MSDPNTTPPCKECNGTGEIAIIGNYKQICPCSRHVDLFLSPGVFVEEIPVLNKEILREAFDKILQTPPGERVMRIEFGSELVDLVDDAAVEVVCGGCGNTATGQSQTLRTAGWSLGRSLCPVCAPAITTWFCRSCPNKAETEHSLDTPIVPPNWTREGEGARCPDCFTSSPIECSRDSAFVSDGRGSIKKVSSKYEMQVWQCARCESKGSAWVTMERRVPKGWIIDQACRLLCDRCSEVSIIPFPDSSSLLGKGSA